MFRLGVETGASFWFGDHLRFTLGGIVGVQGASIRLAGYTEMSKGRPRDASATTYLPWIQPRLAAELFVGEHTGVGIGEYVSDDVFHPQACETGVTLSLRNVSFS